MSRIAELKKELAELEQQEKDKRRKKNEASIAALVKGMSYDEMCELREVLNEHVRSAYVAEVDE